MKKIPLLLLVLFVSITGYSQQHFRFRYKLGKLLRENTSLELKEYEKSFKTYHSKTTIPSGLKGVITKTNKITGDRSKDDTLYIRLWPITKGTVSTDESKLDSEDNYGDFIISLDNINKWRFHKKHPFSKNGFYYLPIPFTATQLFAVNIPFRVNLNNREVGSDFINANISLSRIWGKTRIYKSEFVKPRHRYWGVGLFSGLGTTKNSVDQEEVGLFYGGNIIGSRYNVNLVGTIGFETAVSKNGRTAPYVGFGFGFDLFNITGVGISDDD